MVGEVALEPGLVGALGQPEAPAPLAEPALVPGCAGGELQTHARVGGEHRQHGVRGRGGPELHALERGEGAEQVPPALLEALAGPHVVAGRSTHLGGQLRLAPALEAGRVLAVDQRADLVEEAR